MIGDEELDALFTTLGGQLDDAELDRRVAGIRGALRRLREDQAEAARINALATDPDDELSVTALVTRAAEGDPVAWEEIVDRYAPLVWSICRRFQLSGHEIEDVAQNVWLLLVEQLGKLPEPAALAGWLAATTRRECLRVATASRRPEPLEPPDAAVTDEEVSRAVIERARSMPGREKEVWDYYRNNANALAQLRAPIYEDKVVDFLLELANVTEKKVSREELFKEEEDEKTAA